MRRKALVAAARSLARFSPPRCSGGIHRCLEEIISERSRSWGASGICLRVLDAGGVLLGCVDRVAERWRRCGRMADGPGGIVDREEARVIWAS
jgi:hypothetical protein